MVSTVEARELTRWTQPPDAENRMSGGVGGLTGAIPLVRPDWNGSDTTCGAIDEAHCALMSYIFCGTMDSTLYR
jgi:hypothetical protein